MKEMILQIPFDVKFKPGNLLTNDWEVITVPLLHGLNLAVYNRDLASILINDADIEFLWNQETRSIIANYEKLSFVEFFEAVIQHQWIHK